MGTRHLGTITTAGAVIALLAGCGGGAADGDGVDPARFYEDNPLTVVVNAGSGTLQDQFARMVEPFWEELTGGDMRIENEEAGGGLVGINQVFSEEGNPQVVGAGPIGPHLFTYDLFEAEGAAFSATELQYLITFPSTVGAAMIAIGAGSDYETLDDLRAADTVYFGTPHPDSGASQTASFASEVLGFEMRLRPGYRGNDIAFAAAGGEIDAYSWVGTGVYQHVADGLVQSPLIAVSEERSPLFPDTPALPELVDLTDEQQAMLGLIEALQLRAGLFAPPGVEQAYVDYLRDTLFEAMAHEDFVEQALAVWAQWDDPVTGADTQAMAEAAVDAPAELVDALSAMSRARVE